MTQGHIVRAGGAGLRLAHSDTTEGKPGKGTVERSYEFVLGDRFIHERNTSTYPPQEQNEQGEVHQHWSFLSYDRRGKTLVLRQFHTEGFVNQYRHAAQHSSATRVVLSTSARYPLRLPRGR
jgi:hypothetical protein